MNTEIESLKEALSLSPDNIPLRLMLANALVHASDYLEAEEHFKLIITKDPAHIAARFGLASTYFHQQKYTAAIVVLEELIEPSTTNTDMLLMLSKALLRNNEAAKATEYYKRVLIINPQLKEDELDQNLRNTSTPASTLDDFITSLEENLKFERPKITFDEVGGMQKVKDEIRIKIIQPLQHPEMYKAYGKKIGGGILMYGPPGCGKTHLARATAGQINASFISISIHDVLDMWQGNSEKKLHDLFETARRQTPCVLFFDEIDALGASRSDMRHSASKMLINQFLNELDGMSSDNEGVLVLGATNAPWHLDSAFRRPGRFDRIIFVHPPDAEGREGILKILLKDKPVADIDYKGLAKLTDEFSGADLMAVVNRTIEDKLRESFERGSIQPMNSKDLAKTAKLVKPSTKEWFASARNYALYSNESGIYDEILAYLKISK
jgi:transitional endoplasmic reticulum ATPase